MNVPSIICNIIDEFFISYELFEVMKKYIIIDNECKVIRYNYGDKKILNAQMMQKSLTNLLNYYLITQKFKSQLESYLTVRNLFFIQGKIILRNLISLNNSRCIIH